MTYTSLANFLSEGKSTIAKGPIGLILLEDEIEAASAVRHHLTLGFATIIVLGAAEIGLPDEINDQVIRVQEDVLQDGAVTTIVNAIIAAAPGHWIYYCFNSEFLYYPFCESRTVGELVAFNSEERRNTVLCYIVDLYAADLKAYPNAVWRDDAHFDKAGYYALARSDKEGNIQERQLDFFGGLRWRFEEHVPVDRRRIDRVALFKAKPGLKLLADHTFNDAEYNTYACPWHNNITAAICSFRTAKALKKNPGSRYDIDTFHWRNSEKFSWTSQQLLELGLMEPGQWF